MPSPTSIDLARRRPLWSALSELFLDTETRAQIPTAAMACLASGYDEHTLDHIWTHEVSPVLVYNLLTPAGEWAGFDQDWLRTQILAHRFTLFDGLLSRVNRTQWQEVKRVWAWLKNLPPHERPHYAATLRDLVWCALDPDHTRIETSQLADATVRRIWREVAKPLLVRLHAPDVDPPLDRILFFDK